MGANCSSDNRILDVNVDQSSFATLTEDPTLLEMGFDADVCRLYDFIHVHTEDNDTSLLKVTRKEPLLLMDGDHNNSNNKKQGSSRSTSNGRSGVAGAGEGDRKTYLLKRVTSENPIFMMRLYHTMDVLAELNHPNLPAVLGIHDEDHNKVSFVMEACEGGHLLDRHSIYTEHNARKVIRQILEVVKYLHSQNIVHGDLRTEWFLFVNPKQYHIKLTDFSLAHYQPPENEEQQQQSGCSPSSSRPRIHHDHEPCVHATAPQVLNGRPHSKKNDMWSVGVILYRLLSGHKPFGDTTKDLMANMRDGPTLSFSQQPIWKTISPSAKDLIQKLLAVEPKDRLTAKQALKHGWLSSSIFTANSIRTSMSIVRSSLTSSRPSHPSLIV